MSDGNFKTIYYSDTIIRKKANVNNSCYDLECFFCYVILYSSFFAKVDNTNDKQINSTPKTLQHKQCNIRTVQCKHDNTDINITIKTIKTTGKQQAQ